MSSGFKYQVRDTRDGVVHVTVTNFRWKATIVAFLWLAAWAFVSYKFFILSRAFDALPFFAALFCAVMVCFGFYAFVQSLLRRTMSLSATELRLRSSLCGIAVTRRFRLSEVASLGFGQRSHSHVPLLKLEIRNKQNLSRRNKWIVLASWVTKEQAEEFLQAMRACGFVLPQ